MIAVLALAGASSLPSVVRAQPRVGAGVVAAQVATGTVGTIVGYVGGGLATRSIAKRFGADEDQASKAANVGAWAGAALVTAVGPALLARRGHATASYPAAVGGAVAGGIVSVLTKRLGDRGTFGESGPAALIAGAAIALLPSIGATVAANASRKAR